MATPRVQTTEPRKLNCRKPADFPAFIEAKEKLTDLQTQLGIKEADYRAADKIPKDQRPSSIEYGALALLDGAEVEVEAMVDLRAMLREIEMFKRAIELQNREVELQRRIMSREIAIDLGHEHRAMITDYIVKQKAANESFASLANFRNAVNSMVGCETLLGYRVNDKAKIFFDTAFSEMIVRVQSYLEGKNDV